MLGWLESRDLLASYGIPLAPGVLAADAEAAAAAAVVAGSGAASLSATGPSAAGSRTSGTCAVKLISALHTHKSDEGFVALGLKGGEAVAAACRSMLDRLPADEKFEGFLVQPMIRFDRELILGAHVDPQFGPLVAFGPGGILVELLGGVDFLAVPFSRGQALAFLGRNAAAPLLAAHRGSPAGDIQALASALLAMGALIGENGDRVSSVDINPLVSETESGELFALDFRAEGIRP
ncbi:MAG: hypothetical protein A2Y36_02640 [Treponema sp. GWA1_62_8]|nr:MAG: hypothetical protein A2Y36_02640 [Treponema sp. GWA1_62_8]